MGVKPVDLIGNTRVAVKTSALLGLTALQLGAVTAHQRLVPAGRRQEVFSRHRQAWVKRLLDVFGVKVLRSPGSLPPRQARGRLIVANHRSPYDIAVVMSVFGGRFLSRGDLASWPVLGAAAQAAGTIFVDRASGTSGAAAIRLIRRGLERGDTITVFAEGTTFPGDEVRPFRGGAFVGLHKLDVEIVPVGLAYEPGVEFVDETFPQHLARVARRSRTTVALSVGATVFPMVKARETARMVQEQVQSLVIEARERLTVGLSSDG